MPELYLREFALPQPPRNQKSTQKCQQCQQQFSFAKREHLCKRCYKFVCDSCSPHKEKVYKATMLHREHRLCNTCSTQSEILKKYVQVNGIVWGEDSEMGRLWVRQAGKRDEKKEEGERRTDIRRTDLRRRREEFVSTPQRLWESFNYSFRELTGRAIDASERLKEQAEQQTKKQKQRSAFIHNKVSQQILELLSILISQLGQQKPDPEPLTFLLIFFLCHSSSENALLLTKSALSFLSQREPSIPNILFNLTKLQFSEDQNYKVQNYLEAHLERIWKQLSINYFSIEISIDIVGAIFAKKDCGTELERAIAYVLSKRKEFVLANSARPEAIEIDLLRNHQGLGEGYKKFCKLCEREQSPLKLKAVEVGKQGKEQGTPKDQGGGKNKTKNKPKQLTYQQLLRQCQQLQQKNKSQAEEISRLKKQNSNLTQTSKKLQKQLQSTKKEQQNNFEFSNSNDKDDIDSIESYESYWQEVEEQSDKEITIYGINSNQSDSEKLSQRMRKIAEAGLQPQFKQFDKYRKVVGELSNKSDQGKGKGSESPKKEKKKKLVKKYRPKENHTRLNRMTTMSQKLAKQIEQLNKNNESHSNQDLKLKYEQIVHNKNQEITVLQKQLEILKYSSKLREDQLKAQQKPVPKPIPVIQPQPQPQQSTKVKEQLQKMQEMNRKLLLKIKQLSNLLMDKQEEQVKESEETLESLVQVYEEKSKNANQECAIF